MGCESRAAAGYTSQSGPGALFGFHMVSVYSFKHTRMHAGCQQMFCMPACAFHAGTETQKPEGAVGAEARAVECELVNLILE